MFSFQVIDIKLISEIQGCPLSTYPLILYRWVGKKVWKVILLVTHQQVLFSDQNSMSEDCKQIHCALLSFVSVCWMSSPSRYFNGLLPEAAAVSQMITSISPCRISRSLHVSLLSLFLHPVPFPQWWEETPPPRPPTPWVPNRLLEKRTFRSSFHQDTRMLQELAQGVFSALLMALLSFRCMFGKLCTSSMVYYIWYFQSGLSGFVSLKIKLI